MQVTPPCDTVTLWPPTSTSAARALAAVLAVTVTVIEPEPVPVAGDTVAQPAFDVAVHEQPFIVVTDNVPDPLSLGSESAIGEIVNVHWPAACVTGMLCPATVTVVVRSVFTSLAATVTVTEAGPLPVVGATVAHCAPEVADQLQPAGVVTGTEAVPPCAGIEMVLADTL